MLNAIGLANPGREAFLERDAAAPGRARRADLGLRRRLRGPRVRRDLRAARPRARRGDRAQPLLPERRRGARVGGRDRRRVPGRDRPAALREALAGRVGHRRGRARGRGGGRRRPLAGEHDPRARARPAPAAAPRPRDGRLLGTCAASRSRSPPCTSAGARRRCRSSAWAASARVATCSSWSPAARPTSRSGRCSSPTRRRPDGCGRSLPSELAAAGFERVENAYCAAHDTVVKLRQQALNDASCTSLRGC